MAPSLIPATNRVRAVPPLVSVVIPAYQNADHIEATMRSVLAQTYRSLEVIVADHGSTDGTRALLEQFASDPRVTVLDTPRGGGAVANWNAVTSTATGDFVKLVCGDDLIYPTCVEEQVAAFADGVVMVSCRRDIVNSQGRPVIRGRGLGGVVGRAAGTDAVRETIRRGSNVFGEPACVTFRRQTLVDVGLWHENAHYLIDEATYARVLELGDFVGVPQSLAAFRVSAGQWSVRLASSQAREAAEFHAEFAARHPEVVSRLDVRLGDVRARMMSWQRRLAYVFLAAKGTRS